MRQSSKFAIIVALITMVAAGRGYAQEASSPSAAVASCFVAPVKLADTSIQVFLDAPEALLTEFPAGGLPLSARVRSLIGSSTTTLEPILALLTGATPTQRAAIASGAARASNACRLVNPKVSDLISEQFGELEDTDTLTAFASALSETAVGAIPGGQGPGSDGGAFALSDSNRVVGSQNNYTFGGDTFVLNQASLFSAGQAGNVVGLSVSPTTFAQ